MIPSLIPDITSPTAFFLSEYCDSHDKRGAIDRKQLLSFGPEYLMQNNREMNGQHVYFSWTLCLFCEHNYLKYACFLKKHLSSHQHSPALQLSTNCLMRLPPALALDI